MFQRAASKSTPMLVRFLPVFFCLLILAGFVIPDTEAAKPAIFLEVDLSVRTGSDPFVDDLAVASNQELEYKIVYSCSSSTAACEQGEITVEIPEAYFSYSGSNVSEHIEMVKRNKDRFSFKLRSPLPDGSSGEIFIRGRIRSMKTPHNTQITTSAESKSRGDMRQSNPVTVTVSAYGKHRVDQWPSQPSGATSYPLDQNVVHTFAMCGSSYWEALGVDNAGLVATLPAGVIVNSVGSGGVYDSDTHTITWDLGSHYSSYCRSRAVGLFFPSSAFTDGQEITFSLDGSGNYVGSGPSTIGNNILTLSLYSATDNPALDFDKNASGDEVFGQWLSYFLEAENVGNVPLTGVVVEDQIPSNVKVQQIRSGAYRERGTNFDVSMDMTVRYQTNLNSSWRIWVSWDNISPYATRSAYASDLSLAGNEAITALRVEYDKPILPDYYVSSDFQILGELLEIGWDGNTVAAGERVENCATATASHSAGSLTESACDSTLVVPPYTSMGIGGSPYDLTANPASIHTLSYAVHATRGGDASEPVNDPVMAIELPQGIRFIPGSWRVPYGPTPTFQQIDDFEGMGTTLLIWSWRDSASYEIPLNNSVEVEFDVTIASDAPPETRLEGYVYATNANPGFECDWSSYRSSDSRDLDQDGDTGEAYCERDIDFDIAASAELEAQMWVKGSEDLYPTRYPNVGQVRANGFIDYTLLFKNTSNVPVTDIVLVTNLPEAGDQTLKTGEARGSEWTPLVSGFIEASSGTTVYYSTASRPCTPEIGLTTGCTGGAWSSSPPDDLSSLRAFKIDYGTRELAPGQSITFNYRLITPNDVAVGETAWSSFAYSASRQDTNTVLSAEPNKVGVQVIPADPSQPPPASCPSGYTLLETVAGYVGDPYPSQSHTLTLDSPTPLLLMGWVMEGRPDLGCSAGGASGSEPDPACSLFENEENLELFAVEDGTAVSFGSRLDEGAGSGLENSFYPAGPYMVDITGPAVELRIDSFATAGGLGDALDYAFAVCTSNSGSYDYGDAPEAYGVAENRDDGQTRLGLNIDSELASLHSANADGDDVIGLDDDDGITFIGGASGLISTTQTVQITAYNTLYPTMAVRGWLDFNQDGTFSPDEEIVQQTVARQSGPQLFDVDFQVPGDALCGQTYARFRYVSDLAAPGSGPTGRHAVGETEDYTFAIECAPSVSVSPPPISCPVGYSEIGTWSGDLGGSGLDSVTYNIQTFDIGNILFQGWAMEGHPELGCSAGGDQPSEPSSQCDAQQNNESFELLLNGTQIGAYTDNRGAGGYENAYFSVGPWTGTPLLGQNEIEIAHLYPGSSHSVGYQLMACAAGTAVSSGTDLAIDVSAPLGVTVGDTLSWRVDVTNLSAIDAENVAFTATFPGRIGGISPSAPDWNCATSGGSLSCTYAGGGSSTLPGLSAAATVQVDIPIPALYEPGKEDLIAGSRFDISANVSTVTFEENLANNNDQAGTFIKDQWHVIVPDNAAATLFAHVKFSGSLFPNGLPVEEDYELLSGTRIPSHLQVPLEMGFGYHLEDAPTLCLTNTIDSDECQALEVATGRTLYVEGLVTAADYTITSFSRSGTAVGGYTLVESLTTPMPFTVPLNRLVSHACSSSDRCMALDGSGAAYDWTQAELVYLLLKTPGGRVTSSCPSSPCIIGVDAEPGFYQVSGTISTIVTFIHPDTGVELYRIDNQDETSVTFRLVAPVIATQ